MTLAERDEKKKELEQQIKDTQREFEEDKISFDECTEKEKALRELIDEIDDEFAAEIKKQHDEREKVFKHREYFGSHVEEYLKWIADGKADNGIWDDDFCYGEDWKSKVPEYCRTPDTFYETTGYLEELFFHLSSFHENEVGYIPRQNIYLKIKNSNGEDVVLQISYITGQGSSLGVHIVNRGVANWIFDWDEIVQLAKMEPYQQATWYIQNVICNLNDKALSPDQLAAAYFILGQSIHIGFFEALNKKNFVQKMRECGVAI